MGFMNHRFAKFALAAALFLAGVAAGTWHTSSMAAQNRFGQPKTVVHVVVYKWKNTASEDDKEQALNGIKSLAAKIPASTTAFPKAACIRAARSGGSVNCVAPRAQMP